MTAMTMMKRQPRASHAASITLSGSNGSAGLFDFIARHSPWTGLIRAWRNPCLAVADPAAAYSTYPIKEDWARAKSTVPTNLNAVGIGAHLATDKATNPDPVWVEGGTGSDYVAWNLPLVPGVGQWLFRIDNFSIRGKGPPNSDTNHQIASFDMRSVDSGGTGRTIGSFTGTTALNNGGWQNFTPSSPGNTYLNQYMQLVRTSLNQSSYASLAFAEIEFYGTLSYFR